MSTALSTKRPAPTLPLSTAASASWRANDDVNTDNSGDSDHHSRTGYSCSNSDEAVANQLTLTVVLPDGRKTLIDVDANRSVIDLLIYLCSRTKLNPSDHAIVIPSESDPRYPSPYTASQTIQSLGASTVHLVRKRPVMRNRVAETSSSQALPFEVTNRITINLPQNQKHVVRLRPDIILSDLFQMVVEHRGLDPSRHELRHPNQPEVVLDPTKPLSSYGITEVTMVSSASASSDVSRVQPRFPPSPPKRLHHHVVHVNTGLSEQPVVKSTSGSTASPPPPASVAVNGDVINTATTLQTSPTRQLATEMSEVSASSPPKKRGGFRFQFFTSKKEQKTAPSTSQPVSPKPVSATDTAAAVLASNNVNGSHQSPPTVSSNHQSDLPQQAPPRQKRRAPGPPPSVRESVSNLPSQPVTQAVNGDAAVGSSNSTNQLQNSNGNYVTIPSDSPVTSGTVAAADGTTLEEPSKRRAPQPPIPASAAQETAPTTEIAIDPKNAVYVSPKRPKPQRQSRNLPVIEQQQELPTSSSDSVQEPLYASVRKQHQPSTTAYPANIVVDNSHSDAVVERIEDRQQSYEVTDRNSSDLSARSSTTLDESHVVDVTRSGDVSDSGRSVQVVNTYSSSVGPPLPLPNGNHAKIESTNPSTSSSSSSLAKYERSALANTGTDTGTQSNTRATSSVRSSVDYSRDVIDDDDVTSPPDFDDTRSGIPIDAVMTADGVAGPSAVTRIHIGSSGVATVMRDVKTVSVSLPTNGHRQSFQQIVGSEDEMLSQRSDVDARTPVQRVAAGEPVGVNIVTPAAAAAAVSLPATTVRRSAAIDDDGVWKTSDDDDAASGDVKMIRTAQVAPSNVDLRSNKMVTSAIIVSQSAPPTSERDIATSLPLTQQSLVSRNNSVPVANVKNDTSRSPSGPIPTPRGQTTNDNTQVVAPARATIAEPINTATRDATASTSSSSNNNNSYSIGASSRVYAARGPPPDEGATKFRQPLSSTSSSSGGSPSPNSGEANATVANKDTQRRESGRLEIRSAASASSISAIRDNRRAEYPKPEMPPVIERLNFIDKSASSLPAANKESPANNRANGSSLSSSSTTTAAAATTTGFDAGNKRVVVRPSARSLDIDTLTELHVRIPSSSSVDCSTNSTNSPAIARVSDVESTSSDANYSPRPKWTKPDVDQQNTFSLLNAARKVQPRMSADSEVKSAAIARRATDVTAKPGTNSFTSTSPQKPAPLTVKPDTYNRLTNDRRQNETTKTMTAEPSNVAVVSSTPALQKTASVDSSKSSTPPVTSSTNLSPVSWKDRQSVSSGNRVPPASNETGNSKVYAAVSVPNPRPPMQRSKSTSAAPLTSFSAASVETDRNKVETDGVSGGVIYGGIRLKPVQKVSTDQGANATAAEQDRQPSTAAAAAAADVDNWRNSLEKSQHNLKPATSGAAERINKLEADKALNKSSMVENGKRNEFRSGISVAPALGTRTDLNNNSNDVVDKGVSCERLPASVTTQKATNVTGFNGKTQSPSTAAPPTRPTLKSSQSLISATNNKSTKSGTVITESIQAADAAVGKMNAAKDTSVPRSAADDKATSSSGQFLMRSQSGSQFNGLPTGRTAPNATQNELALRQQVILKSTNTTGRFDAKATGATADKSLDKPVTENYDTNTATSAATFGVTLKSRPKTEVSTYARLPAVTELEQSAISEPSTAPVITEQSPTKHQLRHTKSISEAASDVVGDSKRSTVNDVRDESTSASGVPLVVLQPPKPRQSRLSTEPQKLTIHEQLMIAIRSAGGSTSTAKSPDSDRSSPLQRDAGGSVSSSSNSRVTSSDALNCEEKTRSIGETSGNVTSETNSPRVSNSSPTPPPPPPPPAPPLFNAPPTPVESAQSKPSSSSSSKFRLLDPPKLTPREELMLAIRNAGGSAKKKSNTSGSVSDVSMSAKRQSHVYVDGASKSSVDRSPREIMSSSSSNPVARTSSVAVTDTTKAVNGNSLPSVVPPPPPPPPAPTPPAAPVVPPVLLNGDVKQTSASVKRSSTALRNPPALDPREELLAAIRNAGGLRSLKKVSVTDSH